MKGTKDNAGDDVSKTLEEEEEDEEQEEHRRKTGNREYRRGKNIGRREDRIR